MMCEYAAAAAAKSLQLCPTLCNPICTGGSGQFLADSRRGEHSVPAVRAFAYYSRLFGFYFS